MAKLLIWLSVFALAFIPIPLNPQSKTISPDPPKPHWMDTWLQKLVEPAVLVVLFLSATSGISLIFRNSSETSEKLKRREFKDELTKDLSTAIASEIKVLQTSLDLKIETISLHISYVREDASRHSELIEEMQEQIAVLGDNSKEMKLAMESNFRHDEEFLSLLDSELSRILTAYLKCNVEIKLFRACRRR